MDGKIISVGGDGEEVVAEGQGDNLNGQEYESECLIEEVFEPL